MSIENLLKIAKKESVVKNNLLLPGQVAYNLGLNEIIGSQEKIIYNAMGPDVSTALYLTDPDEIIGIDKGGFSSREILYMYKEFGNNKILPIKTPLYCRNYFEKENIKGKFKKDLEHRKIIGYWDNGDIGRWGREQLLMIELHRLNAKFESIVDKKEYVEINFNWKHPFSNKEKRKIKYFRSDIDKMNAKNFDDIGVYYQKSLPYLEPTIPYLKKMKPFLKKDSSVFIGHWHEDYDKENEMLKKDISCTLGKKFKEIDCEEELSEKLLRFDEESMGYYGNRVHSFLQ